MKRNGCDHKLVRRRGEGSEVAAVTLQGCCVQVGPPFSSLPQHHSEGGAEEKLLNN